jgi:type II secretion system protein I
MYIKQTKGFALIEVLIALTVLSIVIVSLYSGVSTGILAIGQNRNLTRAILIAKSKLHEFKLANMRGTDLKSEPIEEYSGFFLTREVTRYENEILATFLGPFSAKQVVITIEWKDRNRDKKYSLYYIYPEQ